LGELQGGTARLCATIGAYRERDAAGDSAHGKRQNHKRDQDFEQCEPTLAATLEAVSSKDV
jgi:hypothetical protein